MNEGPGIDELYHVIETFDPAIFDRKKEILNEKI